MGATDIAIAAMRAWEAKDADGLASYLADDFICPNLVRQPVGKAEYIRYMKILTTAIPDWSFNPHFLNEQPLVEGDGVLFVIHITGTQSGNVVVPTLAVIPPTDKKISLPNRETQYVVRGDQVLRITTDFSPNGLEEILAQLGMTLPR